MLRFVPWTVFQLCVVPLLAFAVYQDWLTGTGLEKLSVIEWLALFLAHNTVAAVWHAIAIPKKEW